MTSTPSHPHASGSLLGRQPGITTQTSTSGSSTKQAGEQLALLRSVSRHPVYILNKPHRWNYTARTCCAGSYPEMVGLQQGDQAGTAPAPLCAGQTARAWGPVDTWPPILLSLPSSGERPPEGGSWDAKPSPPPTGWVLSEMSPVQASGPCVGSWAGTFPQDVNQMHR